MRLRGTRWGTLSVAVWLAACARPLPPAYDSGTNPLDAADPGADATLPGMDGGLPGTDGALPGTDAVVPPYCGNGIVDPGEDCDDGNTSNTDACVVGCVAAACGDGYALSGIEACDDGNFTNDDACLADCSFAFCGDGYLQTGVEQCDDGDADDTDVCPTTCMDAVCGDGFVRASFEGCDDGNTTSGDGCSSTCVVEGMMGGGCVGAAFGTDTYGYTGCSSTEGTPSCDDLTSIGTNAMLSDDSHLYVPMGFSFEFYGNVYSSVAVGSNGNLNFADAYLGLVNVCIPGTSGYVPTEFIAVWWDDLYPPAPGGSVLYATLGTAPNRRFVVQWKTSGCCSGSDLIDVRAVLYEGTNDIRVCYVDTFLSNSGYDNGISATTGIQQSATSGLQYSCSSAVLSAGLLLTYDHP